MHINHDERKYNCHYVQIATFQLLSKIDDISDYQECDIYLYKTVIRVISNLHIMY